MAHKRVLSKPMGGMTFIWNIDDKVGTQITEKNDPDDVLLIKILFDINIVGSPDAFNITPSCRSSPAINGAMDQSLGFWIYATQVEAPGVVVDGHISPLRSFVSFDLMIMRLNGGAHSKQKDTWENLPNSPLCTPSLKAKLLAPARNS